MKLKSYLLIITTSILLLSLISCGTDSNVIGEIRCEEDALFERVEATGSMYYLSCYESWSIQMDELNAEGNNLYAATLDMPEAFKQEGLQVKFAACFYPFDLPLIFPDPSFFGETYVVRNLEIVEDE